MAADTAGNIYFVAEGCIFKLDQKGVLSRVAGNGRTGYSGDGGLAYPPSVAVDTAGNSYIVEGSRVRKVSPDGVITTIAGNDSYGYSGDAGLATNATLSSAAWIGPEGVAVDGSGNLYVADTGNNAIRVLRPTKTSAVIGAVVDAASQHAGPVAPGKIVVIYGAGLGPAQLTTDQNAGTKVSFNGIAAQLLYASATQVAAIVPLSISGTSVQVMITFQGQVSNM